MTFRPLTALVLLLLVVSTSVAAEELPGAMATIPVVAHTGGADGMEWATDVAVRNDEAAPLEIFLMLTNAPGEPFFSTTIAPGQVMYFTDIVRRTFGIPDGMSPLVIYTMGPRSVTVGASVYGWYRGRVTDPEYVQPIYGRAGGGTQFLSGIALSKYYRTNIGLGNVGDEPASFIIALQRIPGRNLAVNSMTIPPGKLVQASIRDFFPLLTEGEGFYLLIECNSPNGYGYASVIDNGTQDAWFLK